MIFFITSISHLWRSWSEPPCSLIDFRFKEEVTKNLSLLWKIKRSTTLLFYKREIHFLINLLLGLQFFAIQVILVSLCHKQQRKNECVLFFIKPKISVIERIWHVRARHETFSLENGDKDIHLLKLVFVLSPKKEILKKILNCYRTIGSTIIQLRTLYPNINNHIFLFHN